MSATPFKKPSYLSERDAANCYATSRGWVVLYPNGKYDIVQTYKNLDTKIKEYESQAGVPETESVIQPVRPELELAQSKFSRVIQLQAELDKVREQLSEVTEQIQEEAAEAAAAEVAVETAVAAVETKKRGRKAADIPVETEVTEPVAEVAAEVETPAAE